MKKIAAIALARNPNFHERSLRERPCRGSRIRRRVAERGRGCGTRNCRSIMRVTSVLITGPVSALLAGPCKTAMLDILNIVEANGSSAKITAAIQTLQDAVNALPPGTPYVNYAQAAIGLAQVALNTYIAVTQGTPVVAGGTSQGCCSVSASRPIVWTASETAYGSTPADCR